MHRPLVTEVDVRADCQALRVLVRQDGGARRARLAHHVGRARVVEEAVVDAARVPRVDALRPAERRVAHQRVPPAVVVARLEVCAAVVLLDKGC